MSYDPFENKYTVEFSVPQVVTLVSERALLDMAAREIEKAIQSDPDIQILIKELVRDAVSKMNLQELVKHAVAEALKGAA